jgi:hypothetical protein
MRTEQPEAPKFDEQPQASHEAGSVSQPGPLRAPERPDDLRQHATACAIGTATSGTARHNISAQRTLEHGAHVLYGSIQINDRRAKMLMTGECLLLAVSDQVGGQSKRTTTWAALRSAGWLRLS